MHKRDGYQNLYKENMLKASSFLRTSGEKEGSLLSFTRIHNHGMAYRLVMEMATCYEQLVTIKLLKIMFVSHVPQSNHSNTSEEELIKHITKIMYIKSLKLHLYLAYSRHFYS